MAKGLKGVMSQQNFPWRENMKKKLSNLKCWSFQLLKFKVGKINCWFGVFTGTLLDVTMQQRIKCEFNWSFKPFHESSIDILLPGVTFDTTLCDINNIFKFVNRYICLKII